MTQQSNATTCLLMAETRSSFTSNEAAARSAWSPSSLEMKQEHVELDYTAGTLLLPSTIRRWGQLHMNIHSLGR